MATYTTSVLRALRALAGSTSVREIDTGFAALAADVDAAIARPQDPRSGWFDGIGSIAGTHYALRVGPVANLIPSSPGSSVPDSILLDKTTMVPAGRGWEWRVRSKLWVNDVAVPAGVSIRAAITPALKTTPGTHEVFMGPSATIYGAVTSAAGLAASSVTQLDGAWFTAPDTAVDGVEWLLTVAQIGGLMSGNARVFARSWLETRFV